MSIIISKEKDNKEAALNETNGGTGLHSRVPSVPSLKNVLTGKKTDSS